MSRSNWNEKDYNDLLFGGDRHPIFEELEDHSPSGCIVDREIEKHSWIAGVVHGT
jgi:hypothetical protein